MSFPAPIPGAILWCHFPTRELRTRGIKPRPALVLTVGDLPDGTVMAGIAYGTSKKVNDLNRGEFAITPADGEAYMVSGLSLPTKFNLAERLELPYTDKWFSVPPNARHGQTPILGYLHASLYKRAAAVLECCIKASPYYFPRRQSWTQRLVETTTATPSRPARPRRAAGIPTG